MATQTLEVHNSKLCYATLLKIMELLNDYNNLKAVLSYYFTNIDDASEWEIIRNNCYNYLQINTSWMGSGIGSSQSSFSQSVSYSSINLSAMASLFNTLVVDNNITYNTESSIDWTSIQVWYTIMSKISTIYGISKEYAVHKQLFNAIKDIDAIQDKEPEQLVQYSECEMPLPINDTTPSKANYTAFRTQLSSNVYDSILPCYTIDWIQQAIEDSSIGIENVYFSTNITTDGNIDDTGTWEHTPSSTLPNSSIGCVLKLTDNDDGSNITTLSYDSDNSNVFTFATTPGHTYSASIFEIQFGYDTTIPTELPTVNKPTVILPDGGISTWTPITFTSSTLSVNGATFEYHQNSSWQISKYSNFSVIDHQSLNDNVNLTSYTLAPTGILDIETQYYWRVKYKGYTYGESEWSDPGVFWTADSYTCSLGISASGGIGAGELNNHCIIVAPYDAEPTGTNTFNVVADTTALLAITPSPSGTFSYKTDDDSYYINNTGSNASIADWILVDPQEDESMYVDSETEQLALTVTTGNIAIRRDTYACYVNIDGTNTAMSDWILVDVPVKIWWIASEYCANLTYGGYNDWYLPSASELNLIYLNRVVINAIDGTGNFIESDYWSSTVDIFDEKYNAWTQNFSSGSQVTKDRDTKWYYVRPTRRL